MGLVPRKVHHRHNLDIFEKPYGAPDPRSPNPPPQQQKIKFQKP